MTVNLYNYKNENVGTAEIPEKVFAAPWRPSLVHQVLLAQQANKRRPWAHAKGRGEVRGGGRKPWRQKGTGRARHGSIRSPLWRGGGKAHGPTRERSYLQKINRTMKRQAFVSVLSKKLAEGTIKFFDTLEVQEAKTKPIAVTLKKFVPVSKKKKGYDLLLIPGRDSKNLSRAARNLPKAKVVNAKNLSISDLLEYRHVFVDQSAIPVIRDVYARPREK